MLGGRATGVLAASDAGGSEGCEGKRAAAENTPVSRVGNAGMEPAFQLRARE